MDSTVLFWISLGMYLSAGVAVTILWGMCFGGVEGESPKTAAMRRRIFMLFGVTIGLDLFVFPTLTDSIQGKALSLAQSDAASESDNFLEPIAAVFLFLEDGLTVRIAAAIGARRFAEAGALMKMALYAGMVAGVICAAVSIPLAYIDPIFSFFVPYREGNEHTIPPECVAATGNTTITGLQEAARPYWIISSAAFPFNFATKSSLAFFLGSQTFQQWFYVAILSGGVGVALSVLFVQSMQLGAAGVAWVALCTSFVFVVATVLLLLRPSMRKRLHLERVGIERKHWALLRRSAKDGARLMVGDFLGTIQENVPSMLSAQLSLVQQYSLNLLGHVDGRLNLFSQFLGYIGRLSGARHLGEGSHKRFRELVRRMIIQGAVIGCAGVLAAAIGRNALPKGFASSSLVAFQNDANCSFVYDDVFGLVEGAAYWVMVGSVLLSPMSTVYNSLIYAFRDFGFVLKVKALHFVLSIGGTVTAYLLVQGQSVCVGCVDLKLFAIMLAAALPDWVSFGLYVFRLHYVLLARLPDEDSRSEVPVLQEEIRAGVQLDADEGADDDVDALTTFGVSEEEHSLRRRLPSRSEVSSHLDLSQAQAPLLSRPPAAHDVRSTSVSLPGRSDDSSNGGRSNSSQT